MKRTDLEQIKKTIVFIGGFKNGENGKKESVLFGTASLINVDGLNHIVTAKHVVCDIDENGKVINKKKDLFFFMKDQTNGGKPIAGPLDNVTLPWFFHDDNKIDLAIIPFVVKGLSNVISLPTNLFIDEEDVYETNDVFYISYQPNVSVIEKDNDISPIVRKGMISRINNDGSYYVDGSAFPGNSGSPVYMLPSAFKYTDAGISIGGDKLGGKLIGIIGAYVPYQDVAISVQTNRPRIIFEENTGLSLIWSISRIKEIIENEDYKTKIKALKPKLLQ